MLDNLTRQCLLIALTALNTRAEIQDFVCQIDSLEVGLDVLSSIAGKGDRLLEAVLIEGSNTIQLPIEAFDGQLLLIPLHQLEREWQLILGQGANRCSTVNHHLLNLTDERVRRPCP